MAEPPKGHTQFRQIDGGLLVQDMDLINATGDDPDAWKLVAGEPADEATLKDLVFAWRAIRCVKSNAILLAHDQATVGIGMGQVNRVDSCHLAVDRANTLADGADRATGSVAASDAFFPFADGAETLMNAGVKAIVQPGGSIRDEGGHRGGQEGRCDDVPDRHPSLLPLIRRPVTDSRIGRRPSRVRGRSITITNPRGSSMNQHHPYVSEVHEGKPAFEWCVLGVVIVALVVAFLGYTMAATVIIAVTAIVTALLRIIMREKSPWKVRSVLFDAIIGIGLGLGLLLLYFAPSLFWIR